MDHTQKSGSHLEKLENLEKWDTLVKKGSYLEKCAALEKKGHTCKNRSQLEKNGCLMRKKRSQLEKWITHKKSQARKSESLGKMGHT